MYKNLIEEAHKEGLEKITIEAVIGGGERAPHAEV